MLYNTGYTNLREEEQGSDQMPGSDLTGSQSQMNLNNIPSTSATPTGPPPEIGTGNNPSSPSPSTKSKGVSLSSKKSSRPSLSKIILSLDSIPSQQQALQQILNALQIINSREAIVAALASPHTLSSSKVPQGSEPAEPQSERLLKDLSTHFDSFASSQSLASLMMSMEGSIVAKEDDSAQGGGEGPADEAGDFLV